MKNIGIRVKINEKNLFSNLLSGHDSYLNKLNWKLLFIEGTYNDREMLLLETQVNGSEYGIAVTFEEVKGFLIRINDLWNLLLLGQLEKNKAIKKGDIDAIIFDSSDVVIEYFDCSYWTITSSNNEYVESVRRELGGVGDVEIYS